MVFRKRLSFVKLWVWTACFPSKHSCGLMWTARFPSSLVLLSVCSLFVPWRDVYNIVYQIEEVRWDNAVNIHEEKVRKENSILSF